MESAPPDKSWIMKFLQHTKWPSPTQACHINWFHLMTIEGTSQRKPFKPGRITSLPSSVAQTPSFHSTFGANYYHKSNINYVFYSNLIRTLTFHPIHISTAIMITTLTHLYPSAWKPLSTINLIAANHLHNTAPKAMSLAHPTNTLLLESMDTSLTHHTHLRHSILQTQVHH